MPDGMATAFSGSQLYNKKRPVSDSSARVCGCRRGQRLHGCLLRFFMAGTWETAAPSLCTLAREIPRLYLDANVDLHMMNMFQGKSGSVNYLTQTKPVHQDRDTERVCE